MRKVIYSTMASLDGLTDGPNRNLDWVIIETHTFQSGVVLLRYQPTNQDS